MPLNLGSDFDRAVLAAAGIDANQVQPGSVQIDALPDTGNVTIRYTGLASAPAHVVRDLVCDSATTS